MIDSVTRQWLEHARKAGQQLGPRAADGTFAAGVFHVTELLPSLMTDIINTAPEDQKVRFLDAMRRTTMWLENASLGIVHRAAMHCAFLQDDRFLPFICLKIVDSRITGGLGEDQETR